VAWNNRGSTLADVIEKYCKKGDKLYVEGNIEYRTWQDREGQTRYTTEINAREIILLSGKGDAGDSAPMPAKVGAMAKSDESLDDVPDALDAEDDDLPF
jgi:single-strand DNA-binding protein